MQQRLMILGFDADEFAALEKMAIELGLDSGTWPHDLLHMALKAFKDARASKIPSFDNSNVLRG